MASSSSSSSSSATSVVVKVPSPSPRVFVNFRGAELRNNFISHLRKALEEGGINFFIDEYLDPGDHLETLFKEIENSKIALAIFSKRYSESKWCLNELLKILGNVKIRVIPIFFNVTVEDVKSQRGEFGMNLYGDSHPDRSNMQKWEIALKSVTGISGLVRKPDMTESIFVEYIVAAVKKAQKKIPPVSQGVEPTYMISPENEGGEPSNMSSTNISSVTSSGNILSGTFEQPIMNRPLYGIEQRLTQLEERLFDFKYAKRQIVGIVGMPGIGKTTLAEEFFKKWSQKKYAFNKYISANQEQHWWWDTLLEGRGLNDKAKIFRSLIFVVFDDVSKEQVDILLKYRGDFKEGSKIVITTDDKSLIKLLADDIYVVPGLDDKEALQLFKDHAFIDQACSTTGKFLKLSKGFVEYVEGNPQALEEFGKELFGKNEGQWEERLQTLPHCCNPTILTDLSIIYDKLTDPQKDAFLDIAYFFRSEEEDFVKCLLDTESSEVVRDLAEKLLICISAGRIEMPNLLCTLGKELGSFEKNNLAERLCDHGKTIDILWSKHVKKEKYKVRGIFLDTSKFEDTMGKALGEEAFIERFNPENLRYLKIYDSLCPQQCEGERKVRLPDGLHFPFQEIRYLHWQKFPWEELPLDFNPENLIDLRLPHSEIERVWKAAKVCLVWKAAKKAPRLKWVDLSYSKKLIDLSALSKAFNLRRLNLEGCTSLIKLPTEMKNMKSLVFLNLRGCVMLSSLPAKLHLISLKTLILSGCSKFDKFELSSENLEFLHLDGTAITSLPSTIKNFEKLMILNLKECKMLESLPYCLYMLKALEELILSGCVSLKRFPDIKENMENLQILLLDGTSIEEVPNILLHCVKFKDQVICQQPLRMNGVSLLRRLCLSRNQMIRTLGTLEASMSQLYHLKWIDVKYCEKLLSISTLPPNLQCLDAHDCISLETVASPLALLIPTTQQVPSSFIFTNCEKIDQAVKNDIVCYARDKSHILSEALNRHNKGFASEALVTTCFPGNEVPAWFSNRAYGAELKPELPRHWSKNGFVGIALCAIVSFKDYKTRNNDLQLKCRCEFDDVETYCSNFNCHIGGLSETGDEERTIKSTHVFVGYTNWLDIKKCQEEDGKEKCVPTTASIKFEVTSGTNEITNCEVLKCGFSLVYESGSWKTSSETECVSQSYCRIS